MIRVDRIEDDVAVLEIDGRTVDVPATLLPAGAREGDTLALVRVDDPAAAEAAARLARLRARGPQGPGSIDL